MASKRLRHEEEKDYIVRIPLKKDEKTLLDGLVARFRRSRGAERAGIGPAVAYLLRVAFGCLAYHGQQEEIEPRRLSPRTLKTMNEHHGVNVVSQRSLEKPRIKQINPDGTYSWDTEED